MLFGWVFVDVGFCGAVCFGVQALCVAKPCAAFAVALLAHESLGIAT